MHAASCLRFAMAARRRPGHRTAPRSLGRERLAESLSGVSENRLSRKDKRQDRNQGFDSFRMRLTDPDDAIVGDPAQAPLDHLHGLGLHGPGMSCLDPSRREPGLPDPRRASGHATLRAGGTDQPGCADTRQHGPGVRVRTPWRAPHLCTVAGGGVGGVRSGGAPRRVTSSV